MKEARDPKRGVNAEMPGDGMQSVAAIKVIILAGVNYIEAADPKRYCRCEQKNPRIERSAHRDPGRRRGNAERKPQKKMRPARYALRVGIEKHNRERNRRKPQRQPVQPRSRQN